VQCTLCSNTKRTYKAHAGKVDTKLSVRLGTESVLCRTLITNVGSENPPATNADLAFFEE
jgi:hypothetical protein